MEFPLISCIVPVFNSERYLRETLDSIFAQTYRPLEVIVADDGSTDGTPTLVANYGGRVRYVSQNNRGPAAARNLGIRSSAGEFVAFLDADDLWHPEKLARQVTRFQARPELSYCVTYAQNFWGPDLQAEAEKYRDSRIAQPVPGYVTQTLCARRSAFAEVGFFDTSLAHGDSFEWFLRATTKGVAMELLTDVLTYRRLHARNRSRLGATSSRDEFLHILKMSLDSRRSTRPAG